MNSFKFCYLQSCDNLKIKPDEKVLLNIEQSSNSNCLVLSSIPLSIDTCKALGQATSKDVFLTELDLSNCRLDNEGLLCILSGLEKNTCLKSLVLKGNNIKSCGTESLGKFLRHNSNLESLFLEWNGIGVFPEKFAYFCEGLCINNSLKVLDLKNNQINHLCANFLADALSRNFTLKKLDLRWNSIGLLGGRAILKALKKNKSVLKLEISGNDVPLEIQKAIDIAISAAGERYLANNQNIEKSKYFAARLQELESDKNIQLRALMEQLDKKDKDMLYNEKWSSMKFNELQEALLEKNDIVESLTRKLKEMERNLCKVSEDNRNVVLSLNEYDTKLKESKREYQGLLEKERQDKEETEKKLHKELRSLKGENLFIKQQVQDYQVTQASLEEQVLKLSSLVTKLEKMLKLEELSHNEQVSFLNAKLQESLKENDQIRKNEVARIQGEFIDVENNLRQKVVQLENRKCELEKVLVEKDSRITEINNQHEVSVELLKKKMKENEDTLKRQTEERVKVLEATIKKQEDSLSEQLEMMYEIRKKCTENDLLLAEEVHRNQQLQKDLEAKHIEMGASIAKVKLEVKEQLEELVTAKDSLKESHVENKALLQKMEDLQEEHMQEIRRKDEEIKSLLDKIDQLQNKIKNTLLGENERIKNLQLALSSYVNTAKIAIDAELLNVDNEKTGVTS